MRPSICRCLRTMWWMRSGRSMWCLTVSHRVQRAERILEDHLHLRPVEAHVTAVQDVLALVHDRPRGRVVQPGEDARDRALAAAALADEGGDRARAEREAHVVDGAELR